MKLTNDRHELFAQKIAAGMGQTEAYRAIFGNTATASQAASRLRASEDVQARIAELQTVQAESEARDREGVAGMTRDEVLKRLRREADTNDNGAARVAALKLLGQAAGIQEFSQTKVRHVRSPHEMSDSELKQMCDAAEAQIKKRNPKWQLPQAPDGDKVQ